MTDLPLKFPQTPHLAWLGTYAAREDKVLSAEECSRFLHDEVVVEEKVDGANLGICFDTGRIQVWNRGTLLQTGAHPQFQPLWPWLAEHHMRLSEVLGANLILFGEWCFAVHSIHYDRLPDYFLVIDVYDRAMERFWSAERRDELARAAGMAAVPCLAKGHFGLEDLMRLLTTAPSRLGNEPLEGLYLRQEEGNWLSARAKLVRPEFTQAIEAHWMSRPMEKNTVLRSPC